MLPMDTAWISAFSAVMGSLVGAFTSFVTTYANQRAQYRRDFLSKQFAQRENLNSEFINEAARLMAEFARARDGKTKCIGAHLRPGEPDPAERFGRSRSGCEKCDPGDR